MVDLILRFLQKLVVLGGEEEFGRDPTAALLVVTTGVVAEAKAAGPPQKARSLNQ